MSAERPLERRTAARTAVVWEAVQPVLARAAACTVLDIGGGTGGFAVRVAELGHHVNVIDPSPDALAALDRRAREHGVDARVRGQLGDLDDLSELVTPGSIDLVLCHGVLGIVADPEVGLGAIATALAPGGVLSLVVAQRHAAVITRAMAGHFVAAKAELDGLDGLDNTSGSSGEHRFTAAELTDLLERTGFEVSALHGVRVFADLVPSALLDLEPGAAAALLDLERTVANRAEYLTLAAQLHALASRPQG